MRKPTKLLLAASSLVLAIPLSGCTLGGSRPTSFAGKVDTANIGVALRAQAALESGDAVTAVRLAEQAVNNSPRMQAFAPCSATLISRPGASVRPRRPMPMRLR
jgi:hypothetical protein